MSKHTHAHFSDPGRSHQSHDFKSGEEPVPAGELGIIEDHPGALPFDGATDQAAAELEDQGPPPPVPRSDEAQMRNSGIKWNFPTTR